MTIALIAGGVVLFLAFLAWLMWRIFGSGSRNATHGTVSAPGQTTLELPAGRVKLTYQESVYATQSGVIEFWVPDDLEISVLSTARGTPLALKEKSAHQAQTIAGWLPGGPRSRVTIGHVDVPAAGHYSVTVSGGGAGPRPQVLVGR